MASNKPVIHGRDHLPGGADPIPDTAAVAADPGQVVSGEATFDINYMWDRTGLPLSTFIDPTFTLTHAIAYAFDRFNNIYVVNSTPTSASRYPVYKFNCYGVPIINSSGTNGLGTPNTGSSNNQCSGPTDICFDASGNMYIVDAGNSRIQKWDQDGVYVAKWGSSGSSDGQFTFTGGGFPSICFDGTELYVTDTGNDRVQVFNTSGSFQRKWGSSGTSDGQFSLANGIAAAVDGTIYVVDDDVGGGGGASRVQHFSNTGTFLDKYDSATYGSGDGVFKDPNAIDIDADGNIYIADEGNFRVQKFDSSFTHLVSFDPVPSGNNVQGIAVRPPAVPI